LACALQRGAVTGKRQNCRIGGIMIVRSLIVLSSVVALLNPACKKNREAERPDPFYNEEAVEETSAWTAEADELDGAGGTIKGTDEQPDVDQTSDTASGTDEIGDATHTGGRTGSGGMTGSGGATAGTGDTTHTGGRMGSGGGMGTGGRIGTNQA